jgi:hypothetical protein
MYHITNKEAQMRLIHYKVITDNQTKDFNMEIGGLGPLSAYGIKTARELMAQKNGVDADDIIICNIMDFSDTINPAFR